MRFTLKIKPLINITEQKFFSKKIHGVFNIVGYY